MNNSRLITGLCLQVGALVLGYAFVRVLYSIAWLAILVIAIPLFVAGVVVLWNAGGTWVVRLALTLWPLVIPLGVVGYQQAIVALQWRMVRTEVLLIPAGYHGIVNVTFDAPDGSARETEDGKTVFRVGANGELLTRDHSALVYLDEVNRAIDARREFYYVDGGGRRTKIERHREGMGADEVAVYWGVSYALLEPVNGFLEDSRYKFYWFFVGTAEEYARPR